MKKIALILLLALGLVASAQAQNLMPDSMLQKDYENCLGGADADASRVQYCQCVREGMRQWTVDDYGAVAGQINSAGQATPDKVATLAKNCIAQVLH